MGKVTLNFTVLNHQDEIIFKKGYLPAEKIRSVDLKNVKADRSVTILCLPENIIEELGLEPTEQVAVKTAVGVQLRSIYGDVTIKIGERSGVFDCIGLPNGTDILLGVIPMERLGMELDLQKQSYYFLPDKDMKSYLTAY